MKNNYLKIFEEELGRQRLIYSSIRVENVEDESLSTSMYFISKEPGLFSRLLGEVTKTIGEVVSIFPSDNDYHPSCPLRIDVLDEQEIRSLEKFARAYRTRTNSDVELIIDGRRVSTKFLQ